MNNISKTKHDVMIIDTGYHRPRFDAAYLMVEQGCAAFVDCGTNHSVPALLAALKSCGLQPEDVQWLMLTHIHLDHAGGAGRLMQQCPNAQLLVHPRAVRHMVDPSRLEEGVRAVYGDEVYDEQYGELIPISEQRVVVAEDGLVVDFNGRVISIMDTAGHARHHVCYVDEKSQSVFTGDTMGVSYAELSVDGKPFIFPPSSPVDFDPDAWHISVERLGIRPMRWFYLTHYGRVANTQELINTMHDRVDRFARLARETNEENLKSRLSEYLLAAAREHGCNLPDDQILSILELDFEVCAHVVTVWLNRTGQSRV